MTGCCFGLDQNSDKRLNFAVETKSNLQGRSYTKSKKLSFFSLPKTCTIQGKYGRPNFSILPVTMRLFFTNILLIPFPGVNVLYGRPLIYQHHKASNKEDCSNINQLFSLCSLYFTKSWSFEITVFKELDKIISNFQPTTHS